MFKLRLVTLWIIHIEKIKFKISVMEIYLKKIIDFHCGYFILLYICNQKNNMEIYDYRDAVINDIKDYIKDHYTTKELKKRLEEDEVDFYQELYDDMFVSDSVTGNASGSYFFSTWKAEEALCHNLDLLAEAMEEFGYKDDFPLKRGAEACDVMIRCYILGSELWGVLEDMKDTLFEDE